MEKSAIEKIAEDLEKSAIYFAETSDDFCIKNIYTNLAKHARYLAEQEKKAKPTAPASLVEELTELCEEREQMSYEQGSAFISPETISEIVSRYQPDESLAEKKLKEAIAIMQDIRGHGGPVEYESNDDSVGHYVCCGRVSYKEHDEDCWYRRMCEYLNGLTDKEGK